MPYENRTNTTIRRIYSSCSQNMFPIRRTNSSCSENMFPTCHRLSCSLLQTRRRSLYRHVSIIPPVAQMPLLAACFYPASGVHASPGGKSYLYPAGGIPAPSGGKPYLYSASGIAANLTFIPPVAYMPLLAATLFYIPPVCGNPYFYPASGIHVSSGGLLIPYYGNARGCVLHQTLGHLSLCGYPVAETVTGFLDKYLAIS